MAHTATGKRSVSPSAARQTAASKTGRRNKTGRGKQSRGGGKRVEEDDAVHDDEGGQESKLSGWDKEASAHSNVRSVAL